MFQAHSVVKPKSSSYIVNELKICEMTSGYFPGGWRALSKLKVLKALAKFAELHFLKVLQVLRCLNSYTVQVMLHE